MPSQMNIEPQSGTAIMICSGILRPEDAREAATALWAAPEWSGEAAVWDFRMARFEITAAEMQNLAMYILKNQRTPPPKRIAFVAPRDAEFGLSRMFGAYRGTAETLFSVFRDFDQAVLWARLTS